MKTIICFLILILPEISYALTDTMNLTMPYGKEVVVEVKYYDYLTDVVKRYDLLPELSKILKIIGCESGFSQEARNSNFKLMSEKDGIKIYKEVSTDIGMWQINNYYHEKNAEQKGYDIRDPFDNLHYGILLYRDYGDKPWKASRDVCWNL